MAKPIKAKKHKVAPKKNVKADKKIVIVGNYKTGQLAWIKKNGVYNWPVREEDGRARTPAAPSGEDFPTALANVKELWLYANEKSERHVYSANFIRKMTAAEFRAAYPSYAKLGASKQKAYYVFKAKPVDYPSKLGNQIVLARTADFGKRCVKVKKAVEQFKKDGEFAPLAAYLPKELAHVPRPQLRVCEAAVQLEFALLYPANNSFDKGLENQLKIISLFSGAGGLDIGFDQAGFKTSVMVEFDPACCRTLRKNMPNTPVIEGDINQIPTKQILDAAGLKPLEAALVIGGPPCQSFSLAGKRMGMNDPRGMLVLQFLRVVRESLPKAFVMENVRGMTNWENGKAMDAIMTEATMPIDYCGKTYVYKVSYQILNAADFGAPQFRERVFVVGNRKEIGIVAKLGMESSV